jgi:hypothetical protein
MDEKRDFLIKNWFYNLKNGIINESILVLIYSGKIESLPNFDFNIRKQFLVHYSAGVLNYYTLNDKTKNHVLIIDPIEKKQLKLEKINSKILLIPSKHIFFKNINEFVQAYSFEDLAISKNEEYLYYLKKENLIELIQNTDPSYLYAVVQKKLWMLRMIYSNINLMVTQNISIENFPNENLDTDIFMLCHHKILTSRLAVLLYRISFLNLEANTTKIGRSVYETTGSKSKSFTPKMMLSLAINGNVTISQDLHKKKVFKAYDLNVNEKELAVRKEIAIELLSYNLEELTPLLISKATKLPLETINNIESKLY